MTCLSTSNSIYLTFLSILIIHIQFTYSYYKRSTDDVPLILHMRPDTNNSHLAFIQWSYDRTPETFKGFHIYECYSNLSSAFRIRKPLAILDSTKYEIILHNMPETKTPCIEVCAIIQSNLAKCSKSFSCKNKKYFIPSGTMRPLIPNASPIFVKATTKNNYLTVQWRFPFRVIDLNSFEIEISFSPNSDFSLQIPELKFKRRVNANSRKLIIPILSLYFEDEKYITIKVCAVKIILSSIEELNCSDLISIQLVSYQTEQLISNEGMEVNTTMRSAEIKLNSTILKNMNAFEIIIVCLSEGQFDENTGKKRISVKEWRTNKINSETYKLNNLLPSTKYTCNVDTKLSQNSDILQPYSTYSFVFQTKSLELGILPRPQIIGDTYLCNNGIVLNSFSIKLNPLMNENSIDKYILIAWPSTVVKTTELPYEELYSLAEATMSNEPVPLVETSFSPYQLPLTYIFNYVVNFNAYKNGVCYYFILVARSTNQFAASSSRSSKKCIVMRYLTPSEILESQAAGIAGFSIIFLIILSVLFIGVVVTLAVILYLNKKGKLKWLPKFGNFCNKYNISGRIGKSKLYLRIRKFFHEKFSRARTNPESVYQTNPEVPETENEKKTMSEMHDIIDEYEVHSDSEQS